MNLSFDKNAMTMGLFRIAFLEKQNDMKGCLDKTLLT